MVGRTHEKQSARQRARPRPLGPGQYGTPNPNGKFPRATSAILGTGLRESLGTGYLKPLKVCPSCCSYSANSNISMQLPPTCKFGTSQRQGMAARAKTPGPDKYVLPSALMSHHAAIMNSRYI